MAEKTVTRSEAVNIASTVFWGMPKMDPKDTGTVRKIADAIMTAYNKGRSDGIESCSLRIVKG